MFSSWDFDSTSFWNNPKWRLFMIAVVTGVLLVSVLALRGGIVGFWERKGAASSELANVSLPSIVNGELVLPKLATGSAVSGLGATKTQLGVVSANLIGIADQQTQKVSAIRIIGEVNNVGGRIVDGLSPLVKFIDKNGKILGQKIGRYSAGWDFFGIAPGEKTLYDVTVENLLETDKLEIVLNVSSATDSAVLDRLKIASRSMEIKTATYQPSAGSGQGASSSAGEKVQYYSVTGSVVNTLSDPVSDIAIYSWAKDRDGKVFAFNRQDFKNDLLAAGDKIDFRILLLPLKTGEEYDSYEVAAWGKRYRLNL